MKYLPILPAAAAAAGIVSCDTEPKRPDHVNFILINLDDAGNGDFSFSGALGYKTPNIDRLALEGMRYTNFYAAQPISGASRAGLLTGCYPNRIGFAHAPNPGCPYGISDEEETIAEVLKKRDYATAIFGKWHLGDAEKFLPLQHGFDEWYGLPYSNDMWPYHPKWKFPDLPTYEGNEILGYNLDQTTLTTDYTERSVKFIRENRERPFFLYLAHSMPHVPLAVSDKFKGKSEQGLYGDVMMELDWSVGEVLRTLEELGLERNTLVIFTSDNGPAPSFRQLRTNGMRGVKNSLYEGGIRMPFIIRWPGVIEAGKVDDTTVVCAVDLLPSLCKIARARLPKGYRSSGEDMSRALLGKPSVRKGDLMWDFGRNEAFMFPRDRYHRSPSLAIRRGNWKLLLNPDGSNAQLYDIAADINETKNLAEKNPALVRDLSKTVLAWWERRPRIGTGKQ